MRLGACLAQPQALVGFVFLVVAGAEVPLAVAFAGQDMGGDALPNTALGKLQGPAVVGMLAG